MKNRHPSRSGFTLLELMISISLLALIALMLTRVFSESTRAIGRSSDEALLDEAARLLLDSIEQDISQAIIRTNVAFRIYPSARNGTLYFISPSVRKQHAQIPRDTAPMRIITQSGKGTLPELNRYFIIETADDASGTTDSTIANLIRHSDYYFTNSTQRTADFGNAAGATYSGEYAQPSQDEFEECAVLTFMELKVNGDPAWDYNNPDGPPDPSAMPRFVDATLGLVSSTEIRKAQRKNSTNHVLNNERIFTRRIFIRNTGVAP